MPAIEKFIQQNYTDPNLGAASLSEEFRISTFYLSRIFKADMGMGVLDYIHRVRIDAARELLISTDLTLDDVAQKTDFLIGGDLCVYLSSWKELRREHFGFMQKTK